MDVKRDWNVEIDREQMLQTQGPGLQRLLARPGMEEQFEHLMQEARALIAPAACWDHFPIHEVRHDHLLLDGKVRIGGGPVPMVVGGAEELLVGVCTVGPALDARSNEYKQAGDMLSAVLLDDMGSWAVDMVRLEMCNQWTESAEAMGWRTSASLSPGESEWSIKDQSVIFSLLDTAQIGVSLSPSMLMQPLKSLSLIMGRGAQPMGVEGASNCDFCSMRDRCRYREARAQV
jgi:hypothetical protein